MVRYRGLWLEIVWYLVVVSITGQGKRRVHTWRRRRSRGRRRGSRCWRLWCRREWRGGCRGTRAGRRRWESREDACRCWLDVSLVSLWSTVKGEGGRTGFVVKVEKGAQAFPETIRGLSGKDVGSASMLWKKVGDGTSIPIARLDKLIISKAFRQNLANFRFGNRHHVLLLILAEYAPFHPVY